MVDSGNRTALCQAELLSLQAGADTLAQNNSHLTPLLCAAGHGQSLCVTLLIKSGSVREQLAARDMHGSSCLHLAARAGHSECLRYLLKMSDVCAISASNKAGRTVLDEARLSDMDDCLSVVMEKWREAEVRAEAAALQLVSGESDRNGKQQGSPSKGRTGKGEELTGGVALGPSAAGPCKDDVGGPQEGVERVDGPGCQGPDEVSQEGCARTCEIPCGGSGGGFNEASAAADLTGMGPADNRRGLRWAPDGPPAASVAYEELDQATPNVAPRPPGVASMELVTAPPADDSAGQSSYGHLPERLCADVIDLLTSICPSAVALDLQPLHLLGLELNNLSTSQLEALEDVHQALGARVRGELTERDARLREDCASELGRRIEEVKWVRERLGRSSG